MFKAIPLPVEVKTYPKLLEICLADSKKRFSVTPTSRYVGGVSRNDLKLGKEYHEKSFPSLAGVSPDRFLLRREHSGVSTSGATAIA